jgi:hypothetical protein
MSDMNSGDTIHDIAARLEERMEQEQPVADAIQEEPTEPAEDTHEEEVVDSEEVDEVDEGADETEQEAAEEDSEDEEQRWLPSTLDEIAEALEVPVDELLSAVKARTKIDGEEGEVSLAELRKSYQLEKSLTQRAQKLSESEKELAALRQQTEQDYTQRVEYINAMSQVMQQRMAKQYAGIDWAQLREDDPGEFAAKQAEYQRDQQELQAEVGNMIAEQQRLHQQRQYEYQQQLRMTVQEQAKQVPNLIPDWSDESVADRERKEIMDFLKTEIGYPDEALGQVYDAKALRIARDAMLYNKHVRGANVAKKKVRTAPKLVKPGKAKEKQEANSQRKAELRKRLRRSGSVDDAAAYLLERMS